MGEGGVGFIQGIFQRRGKIRDNRIKKEKKKQPLHCWLRRDCGCYCAQLQTVKHDYAVWLSHLLVGLFLPLSPFHSFFFLALYALSLFSHTHSESSQLSGFLNKLRYIVSVSAFCVWLFHIKQMQFAKGQPCLKTKAKKKKMQSI